MSDFSNENLPELDALDQVDLDIEVEALERGVTPNIIFRERMAKLGNHVVSDGTPTWQNKVADLIAKGVRRVRGK